MEDLKIVFASNLISLRKQMNISQLELGEKLNYSDKTISKWERAEGLPDVVTLKAISEIFGVTTDWLLSPHEEKWTPEPERINAKNVVRVALLGIWTIAILVFVVLWLVNIKAWMIFVGAVPACFVTWLVLNSIFYQGKHNMWLVHGLLLSIFVTIYFSLYRFNIWQIIFIAIPAHLIVFLSFRIKNRRKKK